MYSIGIKSSSILQTFASDKQKNLFIWHIIRKFHLQNLLSTREIAFRKRETLLNNPVDDVML